MMNRTVVVLFVLGYAVVNAKRPGNLRQHYPNRPTEATPFAWNRNPVGIHGNHPSASNRRQLLQGGSVYVVSAQKRDGVEWCLDATRGTSLTEDGNYPSMGLRPCAFQAGPTEQLFQPYTGRDLWENPFDGDGLRSQFPGDFCLVVSDEDKKIKDGHRVRLGDCGADGASGGDFSFDVESMINGRGQIQVASNSSLCVTFTGGNPDDDDNMVVSPCQNNDKFYFEFRTGWYQIGSGYLCVTVQEGMMEVGNRILYDTCNGFRSHWRIDGNGLFHSRLNDDYCITAESWEEDSPVRLDKCDPSEEFQHWEWPHGFEAPINLKSEPGLYLVFQGETPEKGDAMVISSSFEEWSGDAVHSP